MALWGWGGAGWGGPGHGIHIYRESIAWCGFFNDDDDIDDDGGGGATACMTSIRLFIFKSTLRGSKLGEEEEEEEEEQEDTKYLKPITEDAHEKQLSKCL